MAKVDLHYFNCALACAKRKGIDVETLLTELAFNIQPSQQRVDSEQMTRLVQLVWRKLGDEFLGCTKNPCKSGSFSFMAKHVFHYNTLERMLAQGISFYNLITDDIQMQLHRRGEQAEFEFVFSDSGEDPDHFFLEFWLIIWHRFASWLVDVKIPLNQVCFTHPKPAHWQQAKLLFPCRHHFNRPVVKFCFPVKYLELSCARTRQDLDQFLRDSPADLITIAGSEQSFNAKIRRILLHNSTESFSCPSLELLAADMSMSAQTLRRRLKVEGTSYPLIKDQIRRDLAIELLLTSNKNVNEISDALGFSEPRSFTRAFKQWTGTTPSQYVKTTDYIF